MSRQLSKLSGYFRQASWLALLAFLIAFPHVTHAAEAPGGMTILVKDQITNRPLSTVQVTITERETNSTQTVETDAQGRIVLEQLDPGLYSVSLNKRGFASSYDPSVRV